MVRLRLKEMNIRSALTVLDFNHGVGREQAVNADGSLRYKLNVSSSDLHAKRYIIKLQFVARQDRNSQSEEDL